MGGDGSQETDPTATIEILAQVHSPPEGDGAAGVSGNGGDRHGRGHKQTPWPEEAREDSPPQGGGKESHCPHPRGVGHLGLMEDGSDI